MARNDQTKLQEAADAFARTQSKAEAARQLGVSISTFKDRLKRAEKAGIGVTEAENHEKFVRHDGDHEIDLDWVSRERIETPDQAVVKAKIDTNIWRIKSSMLKSWEVATKDPEGNVTVTPLWGVRVTLERAVSKDLSDAIEGIIKRMGNHAPKYPRLSRPKRVKDPHMLEVSVFDAHFGKLGWEGETGENYDLKIAERRFESAIEVMLDYASHYNVEKILFPVGNDFFNADNWENTTTHGTRQDTDGRWAKIYEAGMMACVKAIELMVSIAPVEVLYVPGNHDFQSSWAMAKYLSAWFRSCPEVKFDTTPKPRKFVEYGDVMLMFTHGRDEKHSSLPNIAATEEREMWGRTKCTEIHLGHFHKAKMIQFLGVDEHEGTRVRVLPSLSGRDFWHYSKGYISQRAAEAYLWSPTRGYVGHYSATPEEIAVG